MVVCALDAPPHTHPSIARSTLNPPSFHHIPSPQAENGSASSLDFPPTEDILSAAVHLQAPARDGSSAVSRHAFSFDRVFPPESSQETCFEEISELVQSALDGLKV